MDPILIGLLGAVGLLFISNLTLWIKMSSLGKLLNDPDNPGNEKINQHKTKEDLIKLDKDIQELYEINSRIAKIGKRGICKIGITKFNAFSEKSGNQSFAIALLDWSNNGVVVSSLQSAHGNARLFVRPIHRGDATNGAELLTEEKKALERAKQVVF